MWRRRQGGEGAGGAGGGSRTAACSSACSNSEPRHQSARVARRRSPRNQRQTSTSRTMRPAANRRSAAGNTHRAMSADGCSALSPLLPSRSPALPLAATGTEQARTARRRRPSGRCRSRQAASGGDGGSCAGGGGAAHCCCRCSWLALHVPVADSGLRAAPLACKRAGTVPGPPGRCEGGLAGPETQAPIEEAIGAVRGRAAAGQRSLGSPGAALSSWRPLGRLSLRAASAADQGNTGQGGKRL